MQIDLLYLTSLCFIPQILFLTSIIIIGPTIVMIILLYSTRSSESAQHAISDFAISDLATEKKNPGLWDGAQLLFIPADIIHNDDVLKGQNQIINCAGKLIIININFYKISIMDKS